MNDSDKLDPWLNQARKSLKAETAPPRLWQQITAELEHPKIKPARRLGLWLDRWRIPVLASMTVTLLIIGLWQSQLSNGLITPAQARDFALEIDEQVYREHTVYEDRITGLEDEITALNLSAIDNRWQSDFEINLLYDQRISECKSLLKYNPYNPALHETLVTTYRHKLANLNAILIETEKRHV